MICVSRVGSGSLATQTDMNETAHTIWVSCKLPYRTKSNYHRMCRQISWDDNEVSVSHQRDDNRQI